MNRLQRMGLGAATGSAALLFGALAFQYIGGLAPCPMCIWQRWPHAIAIALGLLLLVWPARAVALVGALVVLAGAGIGLYHAGVEQGWWQGPDTCTAPLPGTMEASELLDRILATPVVLCDEIAWEWLGISMAGWNAILSLVLAGLWLRAYASSSASQ